MNIKSRPKAPLRPPTTGPMAKMFTAGPLRTGGENTGRENNLCSGDREKALPIMIDGELLSPPLHVRHGHNQMMVVQFPIILSQINCATISGRGRGRGRGHRDQTARGLIMGSSLGNSIRSGRVLSVRIRFRVFNIGNRSVSECSKVTFL